MKPSLYKEAAFTIAELLVAVAITVLIVVLLGTIFGSMITTSTQATQRTDAFRDARAALQLMRRDLEAGVKAQPAAYFSLDPDATIGPDVRQICALISVKNQPAGGAVAGDVCAVRYYSKWDATSRRYVLRRYFKNSDQTLKTFQANLSNGILAYTDATSMYHDVVGTDDAIASCAWNLQVVAYDDQGKVVNSTSDINNHPTTGPYTCDPSGTTTSPLPESIEVSFRVISTEAARTIASATSGRANAYEVWKVVDNSAPLPADKALYDKLIKPHAYDFRTRIHLK